MKKTILNLAIILLTTFGVYAQTQYKVSNQKFTVAGTSNVHDWTMVSEQASGIAIIELSDGKITEINSLRVSIPSESLKSGKSGMDKIAYKSLKTDKNANITFTLTEVKKMTMKGNDTEIIADGKLNIAGVERNYTMTVTGIVKNGQIIFEGSSLVKMTNHKIDPPTAMLGAVKSGDDTTVAFRVVFVRTSKTGQHSSK
jgi:hypothetical protein